MFDPTLLRPAIVDSFKKLTPRTQFRNPVMFCVYVGSILTTILWIAALAGQAEAPAGFILAIALWLWFTVCSRTSPRRSPKGARRRRPRRCAVRRRT